MRAVLDHVGIAVRNLEEALAFYRDALGLHVEDPEDVASQRVRAHFIPTGESALELLEATASDSAIAKYVEKRGPGIHHITLRVEDIRGALAQLKSRGVRLVDEQPRTGIRLEICVSSASTTARSGWMAAPCLASCRGRSGRKSRRPTSGTASC
jgi:methylmalonyl-CoA/ethylmalonyl-CoA epimerase